MKQKLKQWLKPLALRIAPQDPVLPAIFDQAYGHAQSRQEQKPIDAQGQAIPWFTYPSIEYLDQLDMQDMTVFEWGSGNSSQWFAQRCQSICSVESDKDWFNYVQKSLLSKQELIFAEEANYPDAIKDKGLFDIIIIDALRRYDCAQLAPQYLKEGGMIILDNSDWHPNTSASLRQSKRKFIQIDFHGLGPCNKYTWCTSLFLCPEFRPKLKGERMPGNSLAGLNEISRYDSPWNEASN